MKKIWIVAIVATALLAMWGVVIYIGCATREEDLQDALARLETVEEERIAEERQNLDKVIEEYNSSFTRFPSRVFARMFGFRPYDTYNAE